MVLKPSDLFGLADSMGHFVETFWSYVNWVDSAMLEGTDGAGTRDFKEVTGSMRAHLAGLNRDVRALVNVSDELFKVYVGAKDPFGKDWGDAK